MNLEELRSYCLAKEGVTEGFPFGGDTLVFKVLDKMFAATGLDSPTPGINLKCDPAYALQLREQHPEVQPGYHMNKKHWNTVQLDGGLSRETVRALIDHSYDLVVKSLPKAKRESLS